jgi:dephospho-CoA kinase
MLLLGITGGIGMGKSASASLLHQMGVAVVDTDDLARVVVESGQPALREIQERFGADMLDAQGRLRREVLARLVFNDGSARKQLEEILHPRIRMLWLAQVDDWRMHGQAIGAVVIPLLFETCAAAHFNAVVCVACSDATQRQRLLARGWREEHISQRLQAQWQVGQKMAAADFVIWTEAGLDLHEEQLRKVIKAVQ